MSNEPEGPLPPELEELVAAIRKTWTPPDGAGYEEVTRPDQPVKRRVYAPGARIGADRTGKPTRRGRNETSIRVDHARAHADATRIGKRSSNSRWDGGLNLARCYLVQATMIRDLQARASAQHKHIRRLQRALEKSEVLGVIAEAEPARLKAEVARLKAQIEHLRAALLRQDEVWRARLPQMVRRLGVAGRSN